MTLIIAILLVLGLVGWGCWRAGHAYLKFHGKRIVTCPETKQPAAVELATWQVAVTAPFRSPELRLRDCSRWRARAPCDQVCLAQIAASPEECLVLTILSKWYDGKACSCCGRPVGEIGRWQHMPCLMSPDLRLFEWKDIPSEEIPIVLGTHAPVCWRCLVAETHIS
ncbi:MAG: hypothetical protein ABSC64_09020 [Candidatus Korobacteraceae bacterium]|jgi:hypothetical protein